MCSWFIKAGEYVRGTAVRIGFVATNSITQGEQVGQLWPLLFDRCGLEIEFAHRTFAWGSDARGKAHVHVVIVGLSVAANARPQKRLFSYDTVGGEPHESTHTSLTAYLFDGSRLANPHLVVSEVSKPVNGLPKLIIGSKPIDGGKYIFTREERDAFLEAEPNAAQFVHPFVGSREFLHSEERFILYLGDARPEVLASLSLVRQRIDSVRHFRLASKSAPTRGLASTPTMFHVNVVPFAPFLVIPKVSSERREYVPIGWVSPPTVPSDLLFVLPGASLGLFSLLTSTMHMSWLRHMGGRLKSDFRYSIGLVYNTFPTPSGGVAGLAVLAPLGQAVLDARTEHSSASLADLYDPDLMPTKLRKAHQALDAAVDRLYRREKFTSDRERAEHLFGLYEAMAVQPELGEPPKKARRKRS